MRTKYGCAVGRFAASVAASWRTHSTLMGLVIAILGTSACSGSPVGPSGVTTTSKVDVLDFVLGDPALWSRVGSQAQDQLVDRARQEVCWVKYGEPSMFECWRWDDRWIYHEVDHGLDGTLAGESYRFTDGRWLPRFLEPGEVWSLDVTTNRIRWFLRDCEEAAPGTKSGMPGTGDFPYRQRAWLEPARNVGGELGVRDVLVLEYGPHAPGLEPNAPERFLFARGAGWYRWESPRGDAWFDRPGGPNVGRSAACGE